MRRQQFALDNARSTRRSRLAVAGDTWWAGRSSERSGGQSSARSSAQSGAQSGVRSAVLPGVGLVLAGLSSTAAAAPTLDEVFQSTRNSVGGQSSDPTVMVLFLASLLVVVAVLMWWNSRSENGKSNGAAKAKAAPSKAHPDKLVKAFAKEFKLTRRDVRRLKAMAAEHQVENPLTLLVCPSLMRKKGKR